MKQLTFFSQIKSSIQKMRLRNKLMASYMVALIIPLLIISLTIYNLSANSLEDASEEFASMYTSQTITTIDDFVEGYDQITKSILVDTDIIRLLGNEEQLTMDQLIDNKSIIQRVLVRMLTLKPEIKTVILVSANSIVYPYSRTGVPVDESILLSQEWLKNIRDSKENLVITTVHDRSYYKDQGTGAFFTVGRVLLNYDGSYAGMLLLDLDPYDLIKLNEDFLLAGNRYDIRLVITNRDGGVIYHSDATTGKQTWEEIINQQYKPGNSDDLIVLSNKSNKGNLLLSTEIPLDKLLAKIRNIKNVTLLAIMICIIFIILISFLFSYRITKPIQDLRRSMKRAETGQYTPITLVPLSNDEIGGLVISYNKMILKIKELIEDVFIAEIKQKQAKFLALQTQINPHMLYNTLESIRMKAIVTGQHEIADMIKILARMFKLALRNEIGVNLIRHEVEYAANYIKLQNIRYDNRFTLEVRLSDDVLNTAMIPLVFQPIVENCITHGFQDYNNVLNIVIDEKIIGHDKVLIRIMDNGTKLSAERALDINRVLQMAESDKFKLEMDTGEGIGLKNIAERIKLQYGDKYYVEIRAEIGIGTIVELCIPWQNKRTTNEGVF